MGRFSMSNAALLMSFKVSPREVERVVDRLDITPAEDFDIADAQEVRVAAVQLMLKRYQSLADYIIDMNLYVADAVNRRARLICFPAYTGLLPATFLPQFDTYLQKLRSAGEDGALGAQQLGECLTYFSDCMHDAHFHTMSALAARHRVYIMAGSSLCFSGDELCHRSFLFSDTGDLVGYQDKISLSPLEMELRIEPANEVKVFETPVGQAAILTCEDAGYFEIAQAARGMGAKILLHPTAMRGEYTPLRTTLGLNMRVQENRIYGVQSVLVGDTNLGFAAEGACCAFGPAELTRAGNGVLSRSSGRFEPDILCVTLNLERLAAARNPYRQDRNVEFLEKYLDRLY